MSVDWRELSNHAFACGLVSNLFVQRFHDHRFPRRLILDLVNLEADERLLTHHIDLPTLPAAAVDVCAIVAVTDRDQVGAIVRRACDPAHPPGAKQLVDLAVSQHANHCSQSSLDADRGYQRSCNCDPILLPRTPQMERQVLQKRNSLRLTLLRFCHAMLHNDVRIAAVRPAESSSTNVRSESWAPRNVARTGK